MDTRLSRSVRLALELCLLLGLSIAPASRMITAPSAGALEQAAQKPAPTQGDRPATRTAPPREREHIIEGTKADEVLEGGDGDDWLFGYEGNDVLRGGPGRDTLDGSPG